jgi:2-iminobutanoate/2-iminopropanoate deaminase
LKTHRNPSSIHAPLAAYSHQIEIQGPARLLALSGQVGMAVDRHLPTDAADQFDLALSNVLENLKAAGMGQDDLVKLTFYLTEPIEPEKRLAILGKRLGAHTPCMTLIYVAGLATPEIKVEVDAWASAEAGSGYGS